MDHNQSGNPIQLDEEEKHSDVKRAFDENANSQAAGAIASSDPNDIAEMGIPNMPQMPQMVYHN